jgi:tripartite-type tricarboxylate transporter receptor subunit TctC
MIKALRLSLQAITVSLCAAFLAPAHAQDDYPNKNIRFVVPFPAGGSTDIAARLIGERLSKRLGTTIIIDNQPGANGLIGASTVVRAKPDGYTLLVTSNGIHSAAATGTANFSLKNDLVPVSQIVGGALMLVGSKSAPFNTVQGFIDHAKQNKDKVNIAINAALGGAHMTFESFRRKVGIQYQPIYYPGEPPSLAALISGEAAASIISAPVARQFIEDGKVTALAVTTGERFASLPNVPTLSETVAPGFSEGYSTVMFAPKGTPNEIVQRISRELAEMMKSPDVAKQMLDIGVTPIASTPTEYAALVSAEFYRNTQLIKDLRQAGLVDQ